MKRILLSLLAVVSTSATVSAQGSDLSTLTDAVYVESIDAPQGSQQTLSVRMKNSIEVQTIQFDLYLPDGLTVVKNDDNELMTASKERINKFNYFESSVQTDGAIRLLAQATTNNIAIGVGEIAKIDVRVSATMDMGDYPVVVKNIILVSKENESKEVDEVSTVISVVEPQDSRVLLDETSMTAPEAGIGVDVRVLRTIKANEWSTICLPFGMTAEQVKVAFGNDVQLGDFSSWTSEKDGDGAVVAIKVGFTVVTGIEANHPYIIKVSAPVTEFTANGVDIDAEDEPFVQVGKKASERGKFYGTYTKTTVPAENLFLSGNRFWYSTGNTQTKGLRGYFEFRDVLDAYYDATAARITMSFEEDTTTGISAMEQSASATDHYYDLQGRPVNDNVNVKKGIYLKKGKKIVVK